MKNKLLNGIYLQNIVCSLQRRAPFAPQHVKRLSKKGVSVLVQPSNRRAYPMQVGNYCKNITILVTKKKKWKLLSVGKKEVENGCQEGGQYSVGCKQQWIWNKSK